MNEACCDGGAANQVAGELVERPSYRLDAVHELTTIVGTFE